MTGGDLNRLAWAIALFTFACLFAGAWLESREIIAARDLAPHGGSPVDAPD